MTDSPSQRARDAIPGLSEELDKIPTWFSATVRELRAGRITHEQAKAALRRHSDCLLDVIYGQTTLSSEHNPAGPAYGLVTTPDNTLDPFAAWRALPPDVQQRLGAAAVAVAVANLGLNIAIELADPAAHRPRVAAFSESLSLIYELVTINLLAGDDTTMPPRPDLRPLGIRQCRDCGCTDDYACDGGCHWVQDDLCSACVRPGTA
jgi:hypothetical protein